MNENLFIYTRLDAKHIHACTSLVKPARIEAAILKVCNAELPGIDPRVGFLLVGVKTQGNAIATCTAQTELIKLEQSTKFDQFWVF